MRRRVRCRTCQRRIEVNGWLALREVMDAHLRTVHPELQTQRLEAKRVVQEQERAFRISVHEVAERARLGSYFDTSATGTGGTQA